MDILFLLRLWPVYGGGETVTICLANELVKRGWGAHVLYFTLFKGKQLPFIDSRIKTTRIEGVDYNEFSTEHADKLQAETAIAHRAAVNYIHSNHIDVVMNQWWPRCFMQCIKEETGVKVIKVHHTAFYTPILDTPGFKGWLKRMFRPLYEIRKRRQAVKVVADTLPFVDRYVFLSPLFQQQFMEMSGRKNDDHKLDAIPNPLVFSQFITSRKYAQKERIALIVGRMFDSQKKISRALRAWQIIEADSRSEGWRLQIVGEGPSVLMYKQLVINLALRNVSFEGFQQPMPYYERARIFLMTSQFEGFGMTLVEAQQQGVVPVVMDSFLSLHDIIKSDKNGVITLNRDEAAFAEAVLELMGDSQRLDSMAQTALTSCRKFSIEKVVDEWERLIKEIELT